MSDRKVEVIAFFKDNPAPEGIVKDLQNHLGPVRLLPFPETPFVPFLNLLLDEVEGKEVLIVLDIHQISWNGIQQSTVLPLLKDNQLIFGASSEFDFAKKELDYFYWKHYPRRGTLFNYLDSNVFIGEKSTVQTFLNEIQSFYPEDALAPTTYRFQRFFADTENAVIHPKVKIVLDYEHRYFGSTSRSITSQPHRSWSFQLLYSRNEREIQTKKHLWHYEYKSGCWVNQVSQNRPFLMNITDARVGEDDSDQTLSSRNKLNVFWKTLRDWFYVQWVNNGHTAMNEVFRFRPNGSKVLDAATCLMVDRLERGLPLSFAHYNDGELSFIKDFLEEKTHQKWFGRKQQQYDPLLAERLHGAMQYQKEGYFVGVPCRTDHPKLRQLADEVVGDYVGKVPAMSIHHNLSYMPRILHALRNRRVYFFKNEYQDLNFFTEFGIDVDAERVTEVPFRNSYLEYDKYASMHFPEESVVILTCGMLAKILTKIWYENHEHLTILALGSSIDDHIQKSNINFELFPNERPITRNIRNSRSFLFGYKKPCKECYDF